jgi:hypothetical protein
LIPALVLAGALATADFLAGRISLEPLVRRITEIAVAFPVGSR